MENSDELIVESKSRLSILVIEDNTDYATNAVEALTQEGHKVVTHSTLEQALHALKGERFDYILSDVHIPENEGSEPTAHVSAILDIAYKTDTSVCFVTKADHHGLLDLRDEGYIALKAVTLGDIALTMTEISRSEKKLTEAELFRKMKVTESKNIKACSKTPDIWKTALEMARDAVTKLNPVGAAIRKVRKTIPGVDFEAKKGMLRICAKG
jgi:CheY-like chemotaxis protein